MKRLASLMCTAALLCLIGTRAAAQNPSADSPAHVAFVDGAVTLERDGQPELAPAAMPLLAGDRLRTADGRVEVLFGDGAKLQLDSASTVDFQSDDIMRLLDGRIRLSIPGPSRDVSYRIDAAAGWVQINEPGEYRISITRGAREPEVELAVLRGSAQLTNGNGETALRAGERAFARAEAAPSSAYVLNSAAWDAFDRWAEERRGESTGASAQYLPESVRPYASTFDRNGDWRYEASYGYVWYPSVSVGWRPYFNGRWASFPSFGWTWIGADAWAWPTHHYGRWGVSGSSWFWIPGRTWAPAWVSWAYAPGYVSWCPLGWDGRPSIQFAGNYSGRGYDPWSAWTVVPYQRFGIGYVNRNVIAGGRIDVRTRGTFAVRQSGPDIRGYAVSRNAAPIYGNGLRGRAPIAAERGRGAGDRGLDQSRPADGAGPGSRRGSTAADDAAAVFRSRRPDSRPAGDSFPAAARPTRDAPGFGERTGPSPEAARGRVPPTRPPDNAVPSDRGRAVSRQGVGRSPDSGASTERGAVPERPAQANAPARLEVPGYRRSPETRPAVPSGGAAGAYSAPDLSPAPRRYGTPDSAPAARPNPAGRPSPAYGSGDDNSPRATPRQTPDPPEPAYRSGGAERRSTPAPPRQDAPARTAPREAAPPRSEAPARGRPAGGQEQGQARRRG